MKKTVFSFIAIVLLTFAYSSQAQINKRLRGFMLSPSVTTADIDELKSYGANFVRYQLGWEGAAVDTANETEYFAWLETALVQLDTIILACERNNLKLLINLHSPPGGYVTREEPAQYRIFTDKWAQDAFVKTWQQIATRYVNNQTVMGYQIVNEPAIRRLVAGLDDWNTLARKTATSIRAIDTVHTIVIPPIFGDTARINKLKPVRLKNIAYSVHMYYPRNFTNQGILGYKNGVQYPTKSNNKTQTLKYLRKLIQFQNKYKAKIFIHEFSVIRWAPNGTGAKYLKDVISIFEKYKWNWAYHAWREYNGWSLEHTNDINNHDKSTTLTDRAKVVMSYFAKNS